MSLTADWDSLRSGLPVSLAFGKGRLRVQYILLTGICQYLSGIKADGEDAALRRPPRQPSGQHLRWNDLQSVHWSTVGLASWVPTVMQSSAQYSALSQWLAHWLTVQRIALLH